MIRYLILLFALLTLLGACSKSDEAATPSASASKVAAQSTGVALEFGGRAGSIDAAGSAVEVHSRATVRGAEGEPTLYLTGAGVRVKSVLGISVDVFVAASYIDLKEKISSTNPMASIARSKAKALKLTLVRDVSAEQLRTAFREALERNGISPDSGPFRELFRALSFDPSSGTEVTFISLTDPRGVDTLHVQSGQLSTAVQGRGLGTAFWKMWFGRTGESESEDLKRDLIGR